MDKKNPEIKKQEKKADAEMSLVVNKSEDANLEFIDYVQASWNPEAVILTFIQKNIGGASPTSTHQEVYSGRLVAQTVLTWPHIIRLRNLLNEAIDNNREEVIKVTTNAFMEGENDVSG